MLHPKCLVTYPIWQACNDEWLVGCEKVIRISVLLLILHLPSVFMCKMVKQWALNLLQACSMTLFYICFVVSVVLQILLQSSSSTSDHNSVHFWKERNMEHKDVMVYSEDSVLTVQTKLTFCRDSHIECRGLEVCSEGDETRWAQVER